MLDDQATELRRGLEKQKDFYKSELLRMNYFKTAEGKQLYELTLTELQQIYANVKYRREVTTDEPS